MSQILILIAHMCIFCVYIHLNIYIIIIFPWSTGSNCCPWVSLLSNCHPFGDNWFFFLAALRFFFLNLMLVVLLYEPRYRFSFIYTAQDLECSTAWDLIYSSFPENSQVWPLWLPVFYSLSIPLGISIRCLGGGRFSFIFPVPLTFLSHHSSFDSLYCIKVINISVL